MDTTKRYSIFISSTYSDLKKVRKDIINAIMQGGDFPICMENFYSSYSNTIDVIKNYIDNCDYFVLIIGERYGDVDPIHKISYTEIEYNYALSIGLKPIVFVKNSSTREEKEEEFLKRIKNNVHSLLSIWNNPTELTTSVINSLIQCKKSDPRQGWIKWNNSIEVCHSVAEYTKFVLDRESESKELIVLPKRLNTIFKPDDMLEEISIQRYGYGVDIESRAKYVEGHKQRYQTFLNFLNAGNIYYELHNKRSLIEYVSGMHHNGVEHLNPQYLISMIEKWKNIIRKYPSNYFVGFVDDVLPFRYEIFDRKYVSMHETVGRHSNSRVCAFLIHDQQVVNQIYIDFKAIWDKLTPSECNSESLCNWIDKNLLSLICTDTKHNVSKTNTQHRKKINLSNTNNTRDIGGIPLKNGKYSKYGVFLRSDFPNELSATDCNILQTYGVSTLIDLRSDRTFQKYPLKLFDKKNINFHHIPFDNNFSNELDGKLKSDVFKATDWADIFINILENQRKWIYSIFDIIYQSKGGVLCFCSKGKDRTGLVSIILLLLAEAKKEDILIDYATSDYYLIESENHSKNIDKSISIEDKMHIVTSIINYIEQKYFNISNYLFTCNVSIEKIQSIKEKLINDK